MGYQQGDNAEQRLTFGRYVLDLHRGCLLLDGREVALRPKTFAVLHYLVTHPGRLIGKEELLEAVWPNLVVTDDTLVQSIGELRRALGDTGARLITTVPRRGYRFEAERSAARPAQGAQLASASLSLEVRNPRAAGGCAHGAGALARPDSGAMCRPAVPDAKPAIAVLPFQHQGDDPAREYLADGLTQDLINSLGRFSALTVMSWNAVAGYKGEAVRPGEIARVLAVRYQVEGSVRYAGDAGTRQCADGRLAGPRVVVGALRRDARRRVRAAGSHHARDRRCARDPRHASSNNGASRRNRPKASTPTTIYCARVRRCNARHAPASSRRANCCGVPSRSIRNTPPRIRRSAKPSTWRFRWGGPSLPTNTGSASRRTPAKR